jgi:2-C-methyl-D-erythritol 4-phosphate cytidylyltransferase
MPVSVLFDMVKKERIHKGSIKTLAVIPAAGAGLRMGGKTAKQFLELEGKPILALTLEKFQVCPAIDAVILVVPPDDIEFCKRTIIERYGLDKVNKVIAGGERRQDSVRLGIEAAGDEYGMVLIHDGVRPFIEAGLIERVVTAAMKDRAVIAALPAKDTAKRVGEDGFVLETCERELLWLVQTPQAFRYGDIMAAHRKAILEGWDQVTDDASLIEKMGIPVKVILGSEYNIKVTTPQDLELARYLLVRSNKGFKNSVALEGKGARV